MRGEQFYSARRGEMPITKDHPDFVDAPRIVNNGNAERTMRGIISGIGMSAAEIGVGFIPGGAEGQDVRMIVGEGYSGFDRFAAAVSIMINVCTFGCAPNYAPGRQAGAHLADITNAPTNPAPVGNPRPVPRALRDPPPASLGSNARALTRNVSLGDRGLRKLKNTWARVRALARGNGVTLPRRASNAATPAAVQDYIESVVENGRTVVGPYFPTSGGFENTIWTVWGDTIVLRSPAGEFMTMFDATGGGQALNFPGGL